jgi:hypothetical protein
MPTQKYLVFMRSVPGTSGSEARPDPAQMQKVYEAFGAWQEKFKGRILDMGGKLKSGGKVVTPSGVTDGPFTEAKEVVGGYMVVAADSYDSALEVVRACPGLIRPGASVEVREIAGG